MAVLTSLQYNRTRVRVARTHQRVRLQAITSAPAGSDVFNLTHRAGYYGRVWVYAGVPQFGWSSYGAPPLLLDSPVTSATGCSECRFAWDARDRILLTCTGASGIEERTSDDDGISFSAATVTFAGGSHGDIALSPMGTLIRSAYNGGVLKVSRQEPGDASPGTAFNAKDSSGVDLSVQNDVHRIIADRWGRWWLHCRITAEGATSIHWSADDGATWTRAYGAIGGITGGSHPGICCGWDGCLYAWAYNGTAVKIMRLEPGDTDWSAAASAVDESAAALAVRDKSFSIAPGVEFPGRLILAAVMNTETTATDRWSADSGSSWKAF